jgi:MraZ protein
VVKSGANSLKVGIGASPALRNQKRRAAFVMASLMGTYYHNIDAKGRLNFPTKLREILGTSFYITKGMDSPCLTVYSCEEWEKLAEKVAALPQTKVAKIQRWLFSGACEGIPDKQGRILIPQGLRKFAGLEKDVVVIGANNKAEIWDQARWEAMNDEMDMDDLLATMRELGF